MATNHSHAVLEAIDKLLAEKPEKVGHDFSEATKRLCAWRDDLVARWRQTHSDEYRGKLEHVNAAISVVVGGQFPLGAVPWHEIAMVRDDLVRLFSLNACEERVRNDLSHWPKGDETDLSTHLGDPPRGSNAARS